MPDEQLSAELDLSIEAALASVDSLSTTLTASLDDSVASFSDAMATAIADATSTDAAITVPVDADASAVPAEIEATAADVGVTVPVDADTATAQADLQALEGDAPTIDVPVSVDTTDAQGALDDLGGSATSASSGMDTASHSAQGLGDAAGFAAAGAGLATGNVRGLGSEVAGLSGGLGSTVAVVGAAAAGIGEIASKGIEAAGATQRFHAILGPTADAVEHIQVGNLNIGLGELANKLGDTRSAMENAAATTSQFAQNSGASKESAAQFSSELIALASRAVALNPALGSVSDVAESMSTRLARGGRFAASFGVSLTSAEINAKALADTGKTSAADLTIFEKSAAAAALATDKYGGSLKQNVEEGSKNAIIQQRSLKASFDEILESLGRPLVAPLFEAIQASLPVFEQFGRVLAEVGVSALPVLTTALQLATPPLQLLADALDLLGPVLPAITAGFLAMGAATTLLPFLLNAVSAAFAAVGVEAVAAGTDIAIASAEMYATPIGLIVGGLALAASAFGLFGDGAQQADTNLTSFTDAVTKANGQLSDSAVKAAQGMLNQRNQADDLRRAHVNLQSVLTGTQNANRQEIDQLREVQTVTEGLTKAHGQESVSLDFTGKTVEQNTARRRELIDALKQENPVLGNTVDALLREDSTNSGVIGTLADLSQGHRDAAQAARDQAAAGTDAASVASTEAAANAAAADSTTNFYLGQQAAQAASTGLADALDAANSASADYTNGIGTAKQYTDDLKTADQELNAELDLLLGRFLSADEALNNYQDATRKANDQILATAFNFDVTTEAGNKNRTTLDQLGESAIQTGQKILDAGGSIEQAAAPLESFRSQLQQIRDVMSAQGLDTTFIDGLIAQTDTGLADLKKRVPDFHDTGSQMIGNQGFAGGITEATPEAQAAAQQAAEAAGIAAGTGVPGFTYSGSRSGEAYATGITNSTPVGEGASNSLATTAAVAAGSGVPGFTSAGGTSAAGYASGISGNAGQASASAASLAAAAAGELRAEAVTFYAIGASAGVGFAQGLLEGRGLSSINAGIVAGSAVAQAHSTVGNPPFPSTVMRELGQSFSLGFAAGIVDRKKDVTDASQSMASAAIPDRAYSSFAAPTGGGSNTMAALLAALAKLSGGTPGPTQRGVFVQNATFGSQDVLADLDWFARTRMAGV